MHVRRPLCVCLLVTSRRYISPAAAALLTDSLAGSHGAEISRPAGGGGGGGDGGGRRGLRGGRVSAVFGRVYSLMLSYTAGSSQSLACLVMKSPELTAALRPHCPPPSSCCPLGFYLPAGELRVLFWSAPVDCCYLQSCTIRCQVHPVCGVTSPSAVFQMQR